MVQLCPKKAQSKENDGWESTSSYLIEKLKKDGRISFYGAYLSNGILFKFHITEQRTGPYVMRGFASPIDPMTGKPVDIGAREKAKYFKSHPEKQGMRCPEVLISRNLYCQSKDRQDVKNVVEKAVQQLYRDYGARLYHVYGVVARPNTILPVIAAAKHVDHFLALRHKNLGAKSFRNYKADIMTITSILPGKPMCEINTKDIQKVFTNAGSSNRKKKLLFEFWEYCVDAGICASQNPVPAVEKKRKSPEALMRGIKRKDRLNLGENDCFHECLAQNPTGPACGVVLMLDGGYSGDIAATFCWADLIFGSSKDCVFVRYSRSDLAGATHNYTAPIFPAGALVLRARYEHLVETYGKEQVDSMPVASQITDPQSPCGAAALKQHARLLLLKEVLTYNDIHELFNEDGRSVSNRVLLSTYETMIRQYLGLESEPGIVKFFLHQSLSGSVTDASYTSFISEEAKDFLYSLMSYLRPEVEVGEEDTIGVISDTREKMVLFPETTRQRVGCLASFVLPPGEELVFAAPHGMTGMVKARGFSENGAIRRKSPKKS